MSAKCSERDGGKSALSGFLCQMLGAIGLKAHCESQRSKTGLATLLSLSEDPAALFHEGYDSDVAIVKTIAGATQKGVVLAQFKYSDAGVDAPIGPSEFRKILNSFQTATDAVRKDNGIVSALFLVTNRKYGPQTQNIVCALHSKASKSKLSKAQQQTARKLTLMSAVEPEFWEDRLWRFGKRYGLRDDELRTGRDRLLVRVLADTVKEKRCEVSQTLIVECLMGASGARQLTHASVHPAIEAGITDELGDLPSHKIIDRSSVQFSFVTSQNRAIIVLTGRGGTGKTAMLRHWARCLTTSRFVSARPASAVTVEWICEQTSAWRGVHGVNESPTDALFRLQTANPELSDPLLYLLIDGIDEQARLSSDHPLRELLRWFRKEDADVQHSVKAAPMAKLIVTCRQYRDFEPMWISNSSGSPRLTSDTPTIIEFEQFTDQEIAELIQCERGSLGESVFSRLMKNNKMPIGLAAEDSFEPEDVGFVASVDQMETNEWMLRNPAIWQAFMSISPHEREAFLEDIESGRKAVAQFVFDRFVNKVLSRSRVLDSDITTRAMAQIASISRSEGISALSRARWNDVGGVVLGFGGLPATTLFREALSGGIIDEEDGRWRWRYPFVEAYLASLCDGGET